MTSIPATRIEDCYEYEELCKQEYTNCKFSAGFVYGHPIDTLYLKIERDDNVDALILLRPDEATAIAWVLTGALWSNSMRDLKNELKEKR